MSRFALALAASAAIVSAARAEAPIVLEPGDAIAFRLGADGSAAETPQRDRAEWTPYELAAARHLSGLPIPDRPVPHPVDLPPGAIPAEPPVTPGLIRLKFFSIAGQHSLLVVENGYDQAIVYRARMHRGDRDAATDVCLVLPRHHSFEHWPHVIDRLDISEIRLVPWRDGDPVPCV